METPYNKPINPDDEYIHEPDEELDDEEEYQKPTITEFVKNNLKMVILLGVVALCVIFFLVSPMLSVKQAPIDNVPTDTSNAVSTPPSADPTSTATTAPPISTPEPTVPAGATFTPSENQAPVIPDSQPVANAFSKAYLNTKGGKDAWLAGMRPYASDLLYGKLENLTVDIIPVGNVNTVSLRRDDIHGATYDVTMDDANKTRFVVHVSYDTEKLKWVADLLSN